MTHWNAARVLAVVFAIEGAWMVLRALVAVVEGGAFSSALSSGLWLFGIVLFPGSLVGAAWFLWRQDPPTLLLAAIARTLTVFVAVAANLLFISPAASGYFTLI